MANWRTPAAQVDCVVSAVPILSRGKHRKATSGACFMEFASYLAGERWSDHPACTHPLLASLARQVNDRVSDAYRQQLVRAVPDVIGLTGTDLHIDTAIALHAATTALPVVGEEQQIVLATAIVNTERLVAELDGVRDPAPGPLGRAALELVPGAAPWCRLRRAHSRGARRVFARQTAPAVVRYAVDSLAAPDVPDRDRLLVDLLLTAIADCRRWCDPPPSTTGVEQSADPAQQPQLHG
jgi:hypothetical protein